MKAPSVECDSTTSRGIYCWPWGYRLRESLTVSCLEHIRDRTKSPLWNLWEFFGVAYLGDWRWGDWEMRRFSRSNL